MREHCQPKVSTRFKKKKNQLGPVEKTYSISYIFQYFNNTVRHEVLKLNVSYRLKSSKQPTLEHTNSNGLN